jgi:hypothetical protein
LKNFNIKVHSYEEGMGEGMQKSKAYYPKAVDLQEGAVCATALMDVNYSIAPSHHQFFQ